tara:strand:+ start:384 stop:611 length:228 start_codon:yes stop_codon:yes gene_type:complete
MNLHKVPAESARIFNRAVTNEENIRADGSIDWDYVQADFYIDSSLPMALTDKVWDILVESYHMAPWERRKLEIVV